jgi:hypothetical protein
MTSLNSDLELKLIKEKIENLKKVDSEFVQTEANRIALNVGELIGRSMEENNYLLTYNLYLSLSENFSTASYLAPRNIQKILKEYSALWETMSNYVKIDCIKNNIKIENFWNK